jgi:hypothetical protein
MGQGDSKEETMRKLGFTFITATALIAGGSSNVLAAPVGTPGGIRVAIEDLTLIANAQYVWEGRRHCWYPDGWHGPGWYWCGYAWRRGYGWGGPAGYRGWEHRERMEERHEHREERREYRRY